MQHKYVLLWLIAAYFCHDNSRHILMPSEAFLYIFITFNSATNYLGWWGFAGRKRLDSPSQSCKAVQFLLQSNHVQIWPAKAQRAQET